MRNKLFQYTVGNSILVVSILAILNFRRFFISRMSIPPRKIYCPRKLEFFNNWITEDYIKFYSLFIVFSKIKH